MFLHILKKDLKRNKTMNVILFLFIVLASIFVASGLNNLVSVMNGTGYYLEQAGVGDYNVIVRNTGDNAAEDVIKKSKATKSYTYDDALMFSKDIKDGNGKVIKIQNSMKLIESIDKTSLKIFDLSDEEITKVEKGHVYISSTLMRDKGIEKGDKLTLTIGDTAKTFIVDGKAKEALLGSAFMGNVRFFINDEDAEDFYADDMSKESELQLFYIKSDDIPTLQSDLADLEGVQFSGPKNTIMMTYVLDMIVAFVVMILSICLVIISFVILKFSIGFTIQDDFREIGVMKAIGIRNRKIRSLYLTKYMIIALVGAIVGCIISYPFADMLMESVTDNMLLGNSYGRLLNIVGSTLVFLVILGLAYLSTGKIKKATPVDAIRNGETGERFKKKKGYRISKSHAKNTLYLAWNDILSSPKRFMNIIISFGICALFLLVLSNTTATMDSPACIDTFGPRSDIYLPNNISTKELDVSGITDKDKITFDDFLYMENGRDKYVEFMESVEKMLSKEGMPGKAFAVLMYQYKFTFDGKDFSYRMLQPIKNPASDQKIFEGSAPQNKNEVAVGVKMAENTGLKIGDTIEIDFGGKKEKCIVTGTFQSMNNLGDILLLHEDAPTSFETFSGASSFLQITFTDNPTKEEIENRKEKLRDIFETEKVYDQREFCVDTMGALETMQSVEYLLMAITIIVIILVTIMMERSFIADEKKQIAILKAVGFRDGDVIKWQVTRFGILAVIASVIAMILSIPATKLAIGPIFAMMGATEIDFVYNFGSLVKYPLVIVAVTVAIASITALYTKTIEARDTASIE